MHTPTELSPGDPQPSKRRNVSRKLVQTTLFPVNSKENGDEDSDRKAEKNCGAVHIEEDEDLCGNQKRKKKNPKSRASPQAKNSVNKVSYPPAASEPNSSQEENEEDKDFCGSQSKKRKTNRARASPQAKNSSRKDRKTANGSTPKKNVASEGLKGACLGQPSSDPIQIEDASHVHVVPDLRLEAKISAEENSRRNAGKKVHPFFSLWKKKHQELNENGCCLVEIKDSEITFGPVHVFERTEDEALPLDWKNWTFCEEQINCSCVPDSTCPFVFDNFVESLKFDKLQRLFKPSDSQNLPCSPLPAVSALLVDGQATTVQNQEDIQMEAQNTVLHSQLAGYLEPSNVEHQSGILQERMMSYYHSSEKEPMNSLWTHKYKPSRAVEVCGNVDAVNFLSNWLCIWHEKGSQCKKGFPGQIKHELEADDDCSSLFSNRDYLDLDDDDDDDSDVDVDDALRNVLLITGPIGSGKSAAVYACANEHGFDVIELSASDLRNGTILKQNFGEALKSRRLRRSGGDPEGSLSNKKQKIFQSVIGVTVAKEVDTNLIELITMSDNECPQGTTNGSFKENVSVKNQITFGRGEGQPLILVEDVDIIFPEDRGFITAVQQIAETSKGPIILTSNRNDPGLPDNFRKLETSFSFPSSNELFSLLHMVCANEKIKIKAELLNGFISSCHGDIRKTISHLQFWFQSKNIDDWMVQQVFSNLPFDIENGYQMLPNIVPWSFPCKLSELIDEEISKSLITIKGHSTLPDRDEVEPYHLEIQCGEYYHLERKKLEMLKENGAFHDLFELEDTTDATCDPVISSGTPTAFSVRNFRRKHVVMSSDSEEDAVDNSFLEDVKETTMEELPNEANDDLPKTFASDKACSSPLVQKQIHSKFYDSGVNPCQYPETDDVGISTCKSMDISCVPESSFVPETIMYNVVDLEEDMSVGNEMLQSNRIVTKLITRHQDCSDLLVNDFTTIPESSQAESVHGFLHEPVKASQAFHVMDECSRIDFRLRSHYIDTNDHTDIVEFNLDPTDMVQEAWNKLRNCQYDLGQNAATEQLDAFQVVKLASGMSNLFSDADLLTSNFQQEIYEGSEHPLVPIDEDVCTLFNKLMASTIAEHGFCLFAKEIASAVVKMGCDYKMELTSEMLVSDTGRKDLGKLLPRQYMSGRFLGINQSKYDLPRKIKSYVFDTIQSIVPAKSWLALKGSAFCEYLSSLCQISRSEASRLSQGNEKTRKRRGRLSRHYLSTGALMLSPDDISLLCDRDFNSKISSTN